MPFSVVSKLEELFKLLDAKSTQLPTIPFDDAKFRLDFKSLVGDFKNRDMSPQNNKNKKSISFVGKLCEKLISTD